MMLTHEPAGLNRGRRMAPKSCHRSHVPLDFDGRRHVFRVRCRWSPRFLLAMLRTDRRKIALPAARLRELGIARSARPSSDPVAVSENIDPGVRVPQSAGLPGSRHSSGGWHGPASISAPLARTAAPTKLNGLGIDSSHPGSHASVGISAEMFSRTIACAIPHFSARGQIVIRTTPGRVGRGTDQGPATARRA